MCEWASKQEGKIVVSNDPELQKKLIAMYHDSPIGGRSGVIATAKRVGGLLYWKRQ
jgi:hypothetical protein